MAEPRFPGDVRDCPLCGVTRHELLHTYHEAPEGEVRFPLAAGSAYHRELWECAGCGHIRSAHGMDMRALYAGEYVDATYGANGLRISFERVAALPPEASDNAGRCAWIDAFARAQGLGEGGTPSLLDVGAGLGIFPHRMAALGWRATALDPDERAARHIADVAGVPAIHADFLEVATSDLGTYDLVTFNKVLEHVEDPVGMLARARPLLHEGGLTYVELPDGEAAQDEGFGREEFFIDHHHAFSPASYAALVRRAGFRLLQLERLREPSGKFTLRGFAAAGPPTAGQTV